MRKTEVANLPGRNLVDALERHILGNARGHGYGRLRRDDRGSVSLRRPLKRIRQVAGKVPLNSKVNSKSAVVNGPKFNANGT